MRNWKGNSFIAGYLKDGNIWCFCNLELKAIDQLKNLPNLSFQLLFTFCVKPLVLNEVNGNF